MSEVYLLLRTRPFVGLDCPEVYSSLTTDMSGCSWLRCRSVAERLSVQIEEQLSSASPASIAYSHSSSDSYRITPARECWVTHSSIRIYPLVLETHLLTLYTKPILISNWMLNNVCCFLVSKTHFPKIYFNIILLYRHLFRSIVVSSSSTNNISHAFLISQFALYASITEV
jgi:hypothetical protein